MAFFRLLLLATSVLSMSSVVLAQYDPMGYDIPTTPDQQDAIDAASDFLTVIGGENLNGVSISNATLLPGNLGASTPDGSNIGIDFEALEGLLPPGAGPDSGAVMITIFHEIQHLKGWAR